MVGSSQAWSSLSLRIRYPQLGGRMRVLMRQHGHGLQATAAQHQIDTNRKPLVTVACSRASNKCTAHTPATTCRSTSLLVSSIMIQPQVHLRLPCYDFCPVQATAIKSVSNDPDLRRGHRPPVPDLLEMAQSRAATGGVYKGQGRNQSELMTRTYLEFLVHGK